MKNNQGVTLVELIIVILIISILSGATIFGIRSLDSGNAQSTVKRINALLNLVRVENMSKDKPYYLVIEKVSDTYYATVQQPDGSNRKNILKEKLKLRDGVISYQSSNSMSTITRTVEAPVVLEVSYLKDTGAIRADGEGRFINSIDINTTGKSYTIFLISATGKHYIE
jgi:prepilin-type N-terminal cleavage/methylation domain-containing protein